MDYSGLLVEIRGDMRMVSEYASQGDLARARTVLRGLAAKIEALDDLIFAEQMRRESLEARNG
jgi:hypothetical protein